MVTANGLRTHGVRRLPAIHLAGRFLPAEAVLAEPVLAPPA